MVEDHYERLDFATEHEDASERSRNGLDLGGFVRAETFIDVREG